MSNDICFNKVLCFRCTREEQNSPPSINNLGDIVDVNSSNNNSKLINENAPDICGSSV